jgi:exonuclease III
MDELKLFMKEISFDILCINETRLDDTINDNIIKIPGYDIVRRDQDRNGGGVAIYIRSIISYKKHIEFIPDNLESICLEIQKPKSKPLLIVTWYRPPNSKTSLLNVFETSLRKLHSKIENSYLEKHSCKILILSNILLKIRKTRENILIKN